MLGLVLGGLNGLFVAKMKLQPFIVTLVSMTFLRGVTLIFTEGKPITVEEQTKVKLFHMLHLTMFLVERRQVTSF